jgi:hypothetical protein
MRRGPARLAGQAGSTNGALMVFTLRMHAHLAAGTAHEYADEIRRVSADLGPMPLIYRAQPALVLLAAGEPAEAASVLRQFLATPDADLTRAALRAIESADPALVRHLHNAVKTGRSCTYRPDGDVTWHT